MISKFSIAALALVFEGARAEGHSVYGGYVVDGAEFNLRYLPELDQVEFTVTLGDNNWFGLVPGQGNMQSDGDMHVFFGDGSDSYFADYHSVGYKPPALDDTQDLIEVPEHPTELKEGKRITMVARRQIDTGDEMDFVIPLDEEFMMGYAFNGESHKLSYGTKHDLAGSVAITLSSDGTPVWAESVKAEAVDNVSTGEAITENLKDAVSELFGDSAVKMAATSVLAVCVASATF